MKTRLNKRLQFSLCAILTLGFLNSCGDKVKYPIYSLERIEYVPDSLRQEHRLWVTETIRAASQHMTGGDYEDVDETIEQAKQTADELFQVHVIGLRKKINENYWDDLHLSPSELNEKERLILDSLSFAQ